MSGIWFGLCDGCKEMQYVIFITLGEHQFKLCAECEARLRLLGGDYDRLHYTIAQMLKKVDLKCLTGDLAQDAIEKATKIILEARNEWKKKIEAAVQNKVKSDMEHEGFIANDLQQRIRTQLQNPNCLSPDYSTYNIRMEDDLVLHGLGASWNEKVPLPAPQKPSEEELCEISKLLPTTSKLFGK